MIIPSIQQLQADYLAYVQYALIQRNITDDVLNSTDYQAKGFGISGMLSRTYADALQLFESLLPQNAVSTGINNQLSVKGAPATFPSAPAVVVASFNDILPLCNYTLSVGSLISATNGIVYKVLAQSTNSDTITINTSNPSITMSSTTNGVGTGATIGSILTMQSPILPNNNSTNVGISTLTVTASIDGVDQEGLANSVNRLVSINQIPLDEVRSQDFENLLINPVEGVTGCKVLNSNNWTPTTTNFGTFVLSGQPLTDDFLNQGLITNTTTQVYSRTSTSTIIANAKQKILDQNLIGIFPYTSTVSTQYLVNAILPQPYFRINVTLNSGYSLNSKVTLNDGTILTLEQLIKREVRKGICSQPLGAALKIDFSNGKILSSSLSISSIEQQLDVSLGTSNSAGDIGTWLKSRSVLVWDTDKYVYKESLPLALGIPQTNSGNLQWVYDISATPDLIYSNISVVANVGED